MEIILLKDVPYLGKKYEVKTVRDGYGRNFLIPQKLAEFANRGKLKNLETILKTRAEKQVKIETEFIKILSELKDKEIIIKAKANENGELFGSVSKEIISEELKKQGFIVPTEYINLDKLDKNIKHIGEYEIIVQAGEV